MILEDGGTVDLSGFAGTGTDDQQLSLSGNNLILEDGGTVDLSPLAGAGADGVVSNVGFDGSNLNFTGANGGFNGNVDISALAGGDDGVVSNVIFDGSNLDFTGANGGFNGSVDISALAGGNDGVVSNVTFDGANLNFTGAGGGFNGALDISPLNTDNQNAAGVPFTAAGNTTSTNVQDAIEELQTEIDGISGGGAANPNDELITSFELNGTSLDIAEGANVLPSVDLDPTFIASVFTGVLATFGVQTSKKGGSAGGGGGGVSKSDMEKLIAAAAQTAPAQTIRIEQAPVQITPQAPDKK